jgi:Flp pilus assembly protein TadG
MRVKSRTTSSGVNEDLHPIAKRLRALACAGNDGQSLVEFALVLPLFLIIVTGIFSFSIALSHQETLTQVVGVGGQYLQQIRTSTTDPCKDTFTAITNAAPNLTPANITLTLTMNGTAVKANTCSGDESDLVQGGPVTIEATYPCQFSVYGFKFVPTCNLYAEVSEYEY